MAGFARIALQLVDEDSIYLYTDIVNRYSDISIEVKMTAGERIVGLRKQRNITQAGLSKMSGVSQSSVSAIESGGQAPTETTLKKLCSALDVTLVEFFAGVELNAEDLDVLTDGTVVQPRSTKNPKIDKIVKDLYTLSNEQLQAIEAVITAMKNAK